MWDMPEKLYKYRPMSDQMMVGRVVDIVENSRIYLSPPTAFNDPFDCRPPVRCILNDEEFSSYLLKQVLRHYPGYTEEQVKKHLSEVVGNPQLDPRYEPLASQAQTMAHQELFKSLGVFCASEKNNDVLMWAHYADSHRGICLEFNGNSGIMRRAKKVAYDNSRPTVRLFDAVHNSTTQMMNATLAKSLHWEYEKEWRIVHPNPGFLPFDPDDLTGVIFGAATDEQTVATVVESVARSQSQLQLYRSVPDPNNYDYFIERF